MQTQMSQSSNTTLYPDQRNTQSVRAPANPYVDDLIAQVSDDATQAFRRGSLPNIRGGAQAAGQFGGSRHGIVEGIASGDLAKQLATTAAELRYRDWERQRQEELQSQMNQSQMYNFSPNGNYGTDYSQMALQREQMDLQRYLAEQSNALSSMGMMGQFAGQGVQNSMGAFQGASNPLLQLLMGGSQLGQSGQLGGMGMLGSYLGIPQQAAQGLWGMGQGATGFNHANADRGVGLGMYNAQTGGQTWQALMAGLLGLNPGQFGTTSRDYDMNGVNVGMAPQQYQGPSPNAAGIGSAINMFGLLSGMMGGGGATSGLPSFLQGGGTGYNPLAGLLG